jgi:hypothetical protein
MERYCWTMTLAAERSCCVRPGSSVLDCGSKLDSLCVGLHIQLTRRIVGPDLSKIRLAPDLPERNSCVSRGASGLCFSNSF